VKVIGLVLTELGGARMKCLCEDKKERICRVPGRLKSRLWVKEGDYVMIEVSDIQPDKGDIIEVIPKTKIDEMKQKGEIDI